MPVTPGVRPAALLGSARRRGRPWPGPTPRLTVLRSLTAKPVVVSRTGTADGRNHPRRQARARSRAPGAVSMRKFVLILLIRGGRAAHGVSAGDEASAVKLLVGRSTIVDVGTPIARVSLTSADIADALVTSPSQLLVNGKMPGTISMFVWERPAASPLRSGGPARPRARSTSRCKSCSRARRSRRRAAARASCCRAWCSSKDDLDKAANVAAGYVEKADDVVNLLQMQESTAEQPGAAARALRRSQPQRDDRARRVVLHRRHRLQGRARPHDDRAVRPLAGVRQLRSRASRSWCSATS